MLRAGRGNRNIIGIGYPILQAACLPIFSSDLLRKWLPSISKEVFFGMQCAAIPALGAGSCSARKQCRFPDRFSGFLLE